MCACVCILVRCSVLQCVAACCSVLQYVARDKVACASSGYEAATPDTSVLQCVAVCCSVLQCVVVC